MKTAIRMRDDLARDGYSVPAFIDKEGIPAHRCYISADDLAESILLPDLCDDTSLMYNFNRVQLKDGRIFFFIGVDLDMEMLV
jgi:hypothetical protein